MADYTLAATITMTDKATGAAKQFTTELKEMGRAAEDAGQKSATGMRRITEGAQDLKATLDIWAGAIGQVKGFATEMYEMGKAGAEVLNVRENFAAMAGEVGVSSTTMLSAMRKAAEGTVSDMDLMRSSMGALRYSFGNDVGAMSTFMAYAEMASDRYGGTTTENFETIIDSLGRLRPAMLVTKGIIIDETKLYQAYADKLGVSVTKLDDNTRRQILLKAALEQTEIALAANTSGAGALADGYERLEAKIANVSDELKTQAAPNVLALVEGLLLGSDAAGLFKEALGAGVGAELVAVIQGKNLLQVLQAGKYAFEDTAKGATAAATATRDYATQAESAAAQAKVAAGETKGFVSELDKIPATKTVTIQEKLAPPEMPGAPGAEAGTREEAKKRLDDLPRLRKEREEVWMASINEAAKISGDKRVQEALAAMGRESAGYSATLASRKTAAAEYTTYVSTEEAAIVAMRNKAATSGGEADWKAAGVREQQLNEAKKRYADSLLGDEGEDAAHLTRKNTLWGTYWTTAKESTDANLKNTFNAYNEDMTNLKNYGTELRTTMATGKSAVSTFGTDWKRDSKNAWDQGRKDIAEWGAELDAVVDKPRTIVVTMVYVGATTPSSEAERQARRNAGRGEQEAQFGGIFTRATHALIGEAGAEAVIPLTKPARAAELLRQVGLILPTSISPMGSGGAVSTNNVGGDTYNITVNDQANAALLASLIDQRRQARLNAFMGE
jgi:hypothetical protein